MKTINRKTIGILIISILLVSIIILNISNKNIKLDEVKLKNTNSNKEMFAIMVYDEDANDYVPYTKNNTFPSPSDGYIYNSNRSGCIDTNGLKIENAITYNEERHTVIVETSNTTYCYMYYDLKPSDLKINVTVNGIHNPSQQYAYYDKELNCENGTALYNNKYNGISFRSGQMNCSINYKTPSTSYPTLKSKVETVGTSGTGSIVDEDTAGYRYEGQDPNNYVWFNNELWRIIGSIPTKTSSGTKNLVKIIRNQSIGGIVYDAKLSNYTGAWGSNTLYTLLNHYYYLPSSSSINTKRIKDATDTTYCYGYVESTYKSKTKCNYTEIGIEYNSYYGRMVQNVYWNTGTGDTLLDVSTVYGTEKDTQTVQGYVGLMTASDYGYATSASHTVGLGNYNDESHTLNDWLYGQGNELTCSQSYSYASKIGLVSYFGNIGNVYVYNGYAVRPVLYLNAGVYVISGTGSISDPYIIGMS